MAANTSRTAGFDPRYDRAQTVDGAKARYLSDECPEYDEAALEADVDRLLSGGKNPDRDTYDEYTAPMLGYF